MTNRQRALIAVIVFAFESNELANHAEYGVHDMSDGSGDTRYLFRRTLSSDEIYLVDDEENRVESKDIIFTDRIIKIKIKWMSTTRHEELELDILRRKREFNGHDYGRYQFKGRLESRDQISIEDGEQGWKKFLYRVKR